jgi:hypothetical protein
MTREFFDRWTCNRLLTHTEPLMAADTARTSLPAAQLTM